MPPPSALLWRPLQLPLLPTLVHHAQQPGTFHRTKLDHVILLLTILKPLPIALEQNPYHLSQILKGLHPLSLLTLCNPDPHLCSLLQPPGLLSSHQTGQGYPLAASFRDMLPWIATCLAHYHYSDLSSSIFIKKPPWPPLPMSSLFNTLLYSLFTVITTWNYLIICFPRKNQNLCWTIYYLPSVQQTCHSVMEGDYFGLTGFVLYEAMLFTTVFIKIFIK